MMYGRIANGVRDPLSDEHPQCSLKYLIPISKLFLSSLFPASRLETLQGALTFFSAHFALTRAQDCEIGCPFCLSQEKTLYGVISVSKFSFRSRNANMQSGMQNVNP